jgi:hypothetical protein
MGEYIKHIIQGEWIIGRRGIKISEWWIITYKITMFSVDFGLDYLPISAIIGLYELKMKHQEIGIK